MAVKRTQNTHIRILGAFIFFAAVLAVLIASAAPAQRSASRQPFAQRLTPLSDSGNSLFLPAVGYDSGEGSTYAGGAYSVAVADVNGDGKPDLLIANGSGGKFNITSTNGSVAVLLGNGDGTFKSAVTYDGGGLQTAFVAVADVNGDGKPDLVVANSYYSNTVGVLIGNGDGTFQPVVTYGSGGGYPWSLLVADVNGDGKPDVLVANSSSCYTCTDGGLVGVLLGSGDGTFQPAATYSSGGFNFFSGASLAAADLNGDGKLDLVVTNACGNYKHCAGESSLGVLLGNGDGTFQAAATYASGGQLATSVAIADANGDGKPDLLVSNSNCPYTAHCRPGTIGVLIGNGNGSFEPVALYKSGGDGAHFLAAADLNGDGRIDIAVANFCSLSSLSNCAIGKTGIVGVLLGNGDGTFQLPLTYAAGGTWVADFVVAVDVNGDHRPDLLVVNLLGGSTSGSVGVLLNSGATVCPGGCVTSTALASTANPSVYGQPLTWTATVTGQVLPTGTVKFTWNGHLLGEATLDSRGVATLTRSVLNADAYPLTAVYKGDSVDRGSTSPVLNQVVHPTTCYAALSSSSNPSTQGQAVTFTAIVSSPTVTPRGPVTFTAGSTVLSTAQLIGGKAQFTTSTLPNGSVKVTAIYYGDSTIAKSSASVTQTVQP